MAGSPKHAATDQSSVDWTISVVHDAVLFGPHGRRHRGEAEGELS
jgi:hypothetical protein